MRDFLLEARKSKGLTQEQVAKTCGISRQYYTTIENGTRDCTVKTAKKIGAALDVPWENFFE